MIRRFAVTALLALLGAPASQAATDWRTCPAVPNANGYNVIVLIHAVDYRQSLDESIPKGAKLRNACNFVSKLNSVYEEGSGLGSAEFFQCDKVFANSFPRDPDFIWCGSDHPELRASAAASPKPKPASAQKSPPQADATCSARDIEGNWTRADGARIGMDGMNLKDGGRALMFNHPSGWPAGVFKFFEVRLESGCKYTAKCETVHRNAAGGGYNTTEEACTLELDKAKQQLRASGTHGSFHR